MKEDSQRIVVNKWLPEYITLMRSNVVTKGFITAYKAEIQLIDLLFNGLVVYSDNHTGTDFNNSLKGLTSSDG